MTTILDARSFDRGNSMLNTVDLSSSAAILASTARAYTGAYSLRCGGDDNQFARWRLASNPGAPAVSLWLHPDNTTLFNLNATTTPNVVGIVLRLRLNSGGFINFRWNAGTHTFDAYIGTTLFKAGTIEVSNIDWFHVQIFVTVAAAGNITVLIDGHESINENGDTRVTGGTYADYFYASGGQSGSRYYYVDDLVLGYDGLLGSLRVRERVPSSDVSTVWTSSTGGANYTTVDETPQSDADYNESDTDGEKDELGLTTIDFATLKEAPVALIAWVRARMAEGTGDSIKVGLDKGGTAVDTQSALSASLEYYFHTADEDPDGGGKPWDATSANAATLTYESVIT